MGVVCGFVFSFLAHGNLDHFILAQVKLRVRSPLTGNNFEWARSDVLERDNIGVFVLIERLANLLDEVFLASSSLRFDFSEGYDLVSF